MTIKEICTFEVAKLAKEKGFKEEVFAYYDYEGDLVYAVSPYRGSSIIEILVDKNKQNPIGAEYTSAPTQSLLQRWLREEKKLHIEIIATASGYYWVLNKTNGTSITDSDVLDRWTNEDSGRFDIYEQALEDALKYSLENLV